VACYGPDTHTALLKALISAGFKIPPKGGVVMIGIQHSFQPKFLPTAKKLHDLGYQVRYMWPHAYCYPIVSLCHCTSWVGDSFIGCAYCEHCRGWTSWCFLENTSVWFRLCVEWFNFFLSVETWACWDDVCGQKYYFTVHNWVIDIALPHPTLLVTISTDVRQAEFAIK